MKDAAVDAQIRDRFLPLIEQLAAQPVDAALTSADRALATVIVARPIPAQRVPRHARALSPPTRWRSASPRPPSSAASTSRLPADRRVFLYLPFEHSEDLADQERSVELTAALGDEEYARYAVLHRDVIKRFGRFPHRNAMLGRTSTLEEIKFLKEPGSSF